MVLPHPDFSKIRIVRNLDAPSVVEVDLMKVINNCTEKTTTDEARAVDVELLPGDIVELPVIREKLAEEWKGFDAATAMFLRKAMTYRVSVAYSGKTLPLTYEYNVPSFVNTDAGMLIYQNSERPWLWPTMNGVFAQVAGPNRTISEGSLTRKGRERRTVEHWQFLRDQDFLEVDDVTDAPRRERIVLPGPQ